MLRSAYLLPCVLLLGTLFPQSAHGLYSSQDDVIEADINTFNKIVMKTYHPVMVEFFAPWCGHCKNLAPHYKKAAKGLKGAAKLVAVNCDEDKNRPLCAQYDVKGFPTLKAFPGGIKGMPQDYHGARESVHIQKFMMSLLTTRNIYTIGGNSKKSLTLDEFKKRKDGKYPRIILVHDKPAPPAYFKALSAEFRGRAIFADLKSDKKEIISELKGVDKVPGLIVFPASTENKTDVEGVVYSGDFKLKPLTKFLKDFIPEKSDKKPEKKEEAQEPFDPEIPEITSQEQFDKICNAKQKNACIVAFFLVEPEFKESTDALQTNLQLLKKIKKVFYDKKSSFPFVYIDTAKLGSFLVKELGVSDMYPSLTAIHVKRKVFQNHLGAFDEASISAFLDDLRVGKGKSFQLKDKPLLDAPEAKSPEDL